VITEALAENFPYSKPGQVLISFRELNAIGVVDLQRKELVWVTRGPWIGQHDPELLPNGHILLFDNYAHYRSPEGVSRVIEFDPKTLGIVWQYAGTATRPLESTIRSANQRLPNGNTLITESNGGRLVEVTPTGDIVWEFLNPDRVSGGRGKGELIAIIASARRILPNAIAPDFIAPSSR
jgi:outer membrane protein assembly factor BamB